MLKFLRRFLGTDRPDKRPEIRVARPSLTISRITVRGGATLELEEDDFVVVVGPNNVGKSAMLKDIKFAMENNLRGRFITDINVVKRGSPLDFKAFVDKYFEEAIYKDDGSRSIATYGALFKRPAKPESPTQNSMSSCNALRCVW